MDYSAILKDNLRDHLIVSDYNKNALKGKGNFKKYFKYNIILIYD